MDHIWLTMVEIIQRFAAPSILAQTGGYTSAVFHGNVGSFWNRNNTYKQWGYDYFFDSSYFQEQTDENFIPIWFE